MGRQILSYKINYLYSYRLVTLHTHTHTHKYNDTEWKLTAEQNISL